MDSFTLGPLNCLRFQTPGHQQLAQDERRTLVLLHGFGVPGSDLAWLAEALVHKEATSGRNLEVLLPAGLLPLLPELPSQGRIWFPLDFGALTLAHLQRNWDGLARFVPEGIDDASAALHAALDELAQLGSPRERTVLAGFSQGALLAANYALHATTLPRALLLISGMMICEDTWSPKLGRLEGLPVFQIHSPTDPVVPYVMGKRLAAALSSARAKTSFWDAPPGHYVHISTVDPIAAWLLDVLPS